MMGDGDRRAGFTPLRHARASGIQISRRKVKPYFSPVNLKFAKKAKRGFAFFGGKHGNTSLVMLAQVGIQKGVW
jgi:hypothetical protein